ncbi:MAG: family 78 glycoside hydrolase catalytic domain [Solobacterium sp.]|nr:family 78 glycoside hydrolase catalytic domain [Solobacterium sp.]
MLDHARWITSGSEDKDICMTFQRCFSVPENCVSAVLQITALGVYEAFLNGKPVSDDVLQPGWTVYGKRLQVQTYDITHLLQKENTLAVTVGRGWMRSPLAGWTGDEKMALRRNMPDGLLAEITFTDRNGDTSVLVTDEDWTCYESPVRFAEIYDGEIYDARLEGTCTKERPVTLLERTKDDLIPQEGCPVRECEIIPASKIFTTPNGETVVDFGQEVTGWVRFTVNAHAGDTISFDHAEVLDQAGNFYNANYRNAKAMVSYTCREGEQTHTPHLTFFGFRYIRLLAWPGIPDIHDFEAVSVHSVMKQTGHIHSSHDMLERLVSNIFWSQKDNFLDIPTDCPQRDERLGWTGDAAAFVKAASLNFDCEQFFAKWLNDLKAEQYPDGGVPVVVPNVLPDIPPSAAWGDAAVICPWQLYTTYGNQEILERQYSSMKAWTDYITSVTHDPYLWTGGTHFGDWLGLDAPAGSYKGSSREDLIASAYYANAVSILIRTGRILHRDVSAYEKLHEQIVQTFRRTYPVYHTQTEHVLAYAFHLAEDRQKTADALAQMIRRDGMCTGFVGTPLLLHVLSDAGYTKLAWDLLLNENYPSWLYSVRLGATTTWEHWDGIREDGSFWSTDMNSFNHYAYGSVIDWIYEKAAGIQPLEPGYRRIRIAPHPDRRVGMLSVTLETRSGKIISSWMYLDDTHIRYEITVPQESELVLPDRTMTVKPGIYIIVI